MKSKGVSDGGRTSRGLMAEELRARSHARAPMPCAGREGRAPTSGMLVSTQEPQVISECMCFRGVRACAAWSCAHTSAAVEVLDNLAPANAAGEG
eukprot:4248897-Pleurochrysis_carterae.AAC.3